jgi:hypothetical protein
MSKRISGQENPRGREQDDRGSGLCACDTAIPMKGEQG